MFILSSLIGLEFCVYQVLAFVAWRHGSQSKAPRFKTLPILGTCKMPEFEHHGFRERNKLSKN